MSLASALPSLPRLAACAAAAVAGDGPGLAASIDQAFEAGTPDGALRETLLMVALFAGFPRALDGLAALREAERRAGRNPSSPQPETGLPADGGVRREHFRERGRALFDRVYGTRADDVMAGLLGLDPELPGWIIEDAYGRVLARPGLSAAHRECLAVVQLAALGLRNQLPGHVRGAVHCGASPEDLGACLVAAGSWITVDDAQAARAALDRVIGS